MTIFLAFKTHHIHILNIIWLILCQYIMQFLFRNLILLTISWLVPCLPTVMTPNFGHWLLTWKNLARSQIINIAFISPIFILRKVSKNSQCGLSFWNDRFSMNLVMIQFTFGTFWAKSIHVVFTDISQSMDKGAAKHPKLTEASLVIWTFLWTFILGRIYMAIHTVISFLADTFVQIILAGWNFLFLKDMKVLTVISFFTLSF